MDLGEDENRSAVAETQDMESTSQAEPSTPATASAKPYKYKYKEAAPKPEGVDEREWDMTFSAADSRIYSRCYKKAARSAAARASGETYELALKILAERREKAAQNSNPPAASTSTASTAATIFGAAQESNDSVSTSTTNPSSVPDIAMDQANVKRQTSRGKKMRKVESKSTEDTPEPSSENGSASTTADKVKGKSRPGRNSIKKEMSGDPILQQPQAYSGLQETSQSQPFELDDQPVPDPDKKLPLRGQDPLPNARRESNELNTTFRSMTMDGRVSLDRDASSEVNARDANDFKPEEKTESGNGKRHAGSEPLVRSAVTPVTSRSNTPTPKEASKPKRKTNRGQKKKNSVAKKKAAAKEDKGKDDKSKSKSVEPEQDDEASEGASSNDGGEYCICRGPDDHRPMIACDNCDEWYHCSCVGVKESDVLLIDKYVCQKCHVPGTHFTTWKPMCRLAGCRKPCDLNGDPPSKYCSPEHKTKFWEEAVKRAPDGPSPSRGGALTKGELKSLLNHTKGNVKAFHALGAKPSLPTPPEAIDWNKILTEEEKGRLCQITAEKLVLNTRSGGFKDKEKVVRMAMDRLKKATEARKELVGVCGWDTRLAMNEEEFQVWRNSEAGIHVFETGTLDGSFCEKKRCPRHGAWIKLTLTECRMEDNLVHKQLGKLRAEEHAIKERANTRAAAQL